MATSQHRFRLGEIEYLCMMVRHEGEYVAEYTCPVCDRKFTASRRFASEREGTIRMLAVIYSEHHVRVHLIPDRGK
ncbi:hypothetical protein [Lacipirellula sp.]|uniref:hypothetical protein n=1 Tax=Lacipirellula sp. TaxID=2691419 RepID=UPI003D1074D3